MEREATLSTILEGAREDLLDRWTNYRDEFGPRDDYASDVIAEIADSSVPVYTYDLMRIAAEDNSLATDEPELGPAFDGSPTPVNIIAANVYEAISNDLHAYLQELQRDDEAA